MATPSLHTLVYTTRRGDTLVSIADRFGVSLDQLRRWNKIPSGIKVDPGRRLHVADTSSAAPHCNAAQAWLDIVADGQAARNASEQQFRLSEECDARRIEAILAIDQEHADAKALCKETKIGVEPYYILVFSCALAQAIATMASACGVELSAASNEEAQREPLEAMEWMKC